MLRNNQVGVISKCTKIIVERNRLSIATVESIAIKAVTMKYYLWTPTRGLC